MANFHRIGMKATEGMGRHIDGNLDYEGHAAGLLYLQKAEEKVAKMSRERFLKLWDRECVKFGNEGYNNADKVREREGLAAFYLAGREGRELSSYVKGSPGWDLYERGKRDAMFPRPRMVEIRQIAS